MATSLPGRPLLPRKLKPLSLRGRTHHAPSHGVVSIQAFHRSDLDGFAKRMVSGEAFRDAWRSANERFELFLFDAKKTAERIDRRYAVSRRLSVARSAADRAREIDREFEIQQRWRTFSLDFSRNWPRYRRQLNNFLDTPLGRSFAGACPACLGQFIGFKNQIVRCAGCGNTVRRPKGDLFSGGSKVPKASKSEPQIIDVEFEEK